jgi:hypothetical protein
MTSKVIPNHLETRPKDVEEVLKGLFDTMEIGTLLYIEQLTSDGKLTFGTAGYYSGRQNEAIDISTEEPGIFEQDSPYGACSVPLEYIRKVRLLEKGTSLYPSVIE